MKTYINFLNEKKIHKLNNIDNNELKDFLIYTKENLDEQPRLIRAAYARMQKILNEIRQGNIQNNYKCDILETIYSFIDNSNNNNELKTWANKLYLLSPNDYGILLQIIDEYNQIINKMDKNINNSYFKTNIKGWNFELDGLKLKESNNYKDYCDFGCNYIRTYLDNNPNIDEDKFGEYVSKENNADRDSGELQDINKKEIERIAKKYKNEKIQESISSVFDFLIKLKNNK